MHSNTYTFNTSGIRYLALGDSYTFGEGVAFSSTFPFLLCTKLAEMGIHIKDLTVIAKTGWRTDELYSAIQQTVISPPYDLISLLIGVNNEYQGRSSESFKSEFITLTSTSISLAGGNNNKVFALTIPDYGYTPFGKNKQLLISKRIKQYNEVIHTVCVNQKILCIDITTLSKEALYDESLLVQDGLHPSPKMYRRWVETIAKPVFEKLSA
jgi:lysophospholipase L1-like esterase